MECRACPLACGIDRNTHAGRCGVKGLTIAKYYLHPFEEPPISHKNGSGTIFFCGCNLRCAFCQNFDLSRARRGKTITPKELTDLFKELEEMGADNINLVTPDHLIDELCEALSLYHPDIPVVYNSSGYVTRAALEKISPFIDVWLPDLKFVSPSLSLRYTGRADYFDYAKEAIAFMAQKKIIWSDDKKLLSGILVRHLALPMCTADSFKVLDTLKELLPPDAPISLMRQYTPMGEIENFPELSRRLTPREYRRVVDYALSLGFENLYTQEKSSAETDFIPHWDF